MLKQIRLAAETDLELFIQCLNYYIQDVRPGSKLEVRKFEPIMASIIPLRPEQQDSMTEGMIRHSHLIETTSHYNVGVYYDKELIFVGGVVPVWPNVGEGWLLVSYRFPELFKKASRELLKGIRAYFNSMPYQRIQTPVLEDFKEGKQFLRAFGFEEEGLMKKYGPEGLNYYRYALVR